MYFHQITILWCTAYIWIVLKIFTHVFGKQSHLYEKDKILIIGLVHNQPFAQMINLNKISCSGTLRGSTPERLFKISDWHMTVYIHNLQMYLARNTPIKTCSGIIHGLIQPSIVYLKTKGFKTMNMFICISRYLSAQIIIWIKTYYVHVLDWKSIQIQ